MNTGLVIFKKAQRLQRGTGNLEPGPLPPEKRNVGPKEAAGLYDPGERVSVSEQERESVPTTIGVEIDGREVEIPIWEGMTRGNAEEAARMRMEWGLSPFAPDSELERVQNAAHQGPDDASALHNNHARGTSNVQHLQEGTGGLDYDPSYPGPDTGRGFGSSRPTQRGIGLVANFAGNMIFPGLGMVTGPVASWITRMIQAGLSRQQVQNAVQQYQQGQGAGGGGGSVPPMPSGTVDIGGGGGETGRGFWDRWSASGTPGVGVGIDPMGNPATGREWWSPDFGRWDLGASGQGAGGYDLAGPGGAMGTRGLGFTGHTAQNLGTAIGFGGNLGGDAVVSGAALGGGVLNRNLEQRLARGETLGPVGGYGGPNMLFGAGVTPVAPGIANVINPAALGGASSIQQSRHMGQRQEQQKGTSNVGLTLFRRQLKQPKKEPKL